MRKMAYLHLIDIGGEVAKKTYGHHCFFMVQLITAGVDPKITKMTPDEWNIPSAQNL